MWSLSFVLCFHSTIYYCYSEQQRQSGDQYSVRMNGGSNAPPWPASNAQNGKMFAVPTQLKEDDEIIIRGHMADRMLDIALSQDGSQFNVVSQINVIYPDSHDPHDQITLRRVLNGNSNNIGDFKATDYFYDTSFEVRFIITSNGIRIFIGDSSLETVPLEHSMDDIRFISVTGQVNEMNFKFNNKPIEYS